MTKLGWMLAIGVLTVGSVASADETAATVSAEAAPKKMQVGVDFMLLPAGTLEGSSGSFSQSADTATAFGIVPSFDYRLGKYLAVGIAPQFLFNVKGTNDSKSATEIDVLAHVMGIYAAGAKATVFGSVGMGYSDISPPDWPSGVDDPAGFIIQFAAGGTYTVSGNVYVTGQLGYQAGFQSVTSNGQTADLKSSFLHLAVGGGVRF